MNKRSWLVAVLVSALILSGVMGAQSVSAAETKIIKIGALLSLSGPPAPIGDINKKALDIYSQILNERGIKVGKDTYRLELIYADDQFSPQGAVAAANKLIFSDKVQFLTHYSPSNAALSPLTNANKVILVGRTAGGFIYNAKTMPYNVYFNLVAEVWPGLGYAACTAMPEIKTIGLLISTANKGILDDQIHRIKTFIEKRKGKILEPIWYPLGTQDFTPYLAKLHEGNADLVMVAGPASDAMAVSKLRQSMGKKYPITQTGGYANLKAFIAAMGSFEFSNNIVSEYNAPWEYKVTKISPKHLADMKKFRDLWIAKYTDPIETISTIPFGYTMGQLSLIVEALQQAGTTDPDALMKTLRGGTFDSLLGKFKMTGQKKHGSPVFFGSPGMASILKNGKEVYLGETPITDVDNLP
ncbi:MAG: ABC transporter substrate-binding protein [Deltaproteobacteria bacterium]|nr:ABC transporter substrate-binding protein [Deltaproteobacteria bacterium]